MDRSTDVDRTDNEMHLNASATLDLGPLVGWPLVPWNLYLLHLPSGRRPRVTLGIVLYAGV